MERVFGKKEIYPISLGFNCHVKVYIQMLAEMERGGEGRIYGQRMPFDWLGISMWSLCQIVKADFADFASKSALEYRQRLVKDPALYVTNTRYNCIFPHDFGKNMDKTSDARYAEVESDYLRRIRRWKEIIESGKHILYIRLEMDEKERVVYPDFSQAEDADEKKYLEEFAGLMAGKGIQFTILYLTQKYPTSYDAVNRICYVKFEKPANVKAIGGNEIEEIIRKNIAHVRSAVATSTSH
jgi:hypothetical protein